jgi:hypothetical protein
MNYAKGFDTWLFIRGQEYDAYRIPPPANRRVEDYVTKDYYANYAGGRSYAELVAQFLANIDDWKSEEDWFAAKVFRAAAEWVREASRKVERFLLWVDSFDPHEPWLPPPRFDKYTDPGYRGPKLILPMGAKPVGGTAGSRSTTSGASTRARSRTSTTTSASSTAR